MCAFALFSKLLIYQVKEALESNWCIEAPLGLIGALKTIRVGRLDANRGLALRNEYRFVASAMNDGEFIEGVRAAVNEKDRTPRWKYPTLLDVPQDLIDDLDHPANGGDFLIDVCDEIG